MVFGGVFPRWWFFNSRWWCKSWSLLNNWCMQLREREFGFLYILTSLCSKISPYRWSMNVHNIQSMVGYEKNSHGSWQTHTKPEKSQDTIHNIYTYMRTYLSMHIYYTCEVEARKKAKDSSKRWIWQKSTHIQFGRLVFRYNLLDSPNTIAVYSCRHNDHCRVYVGKTDDNRHGYFVSDLCTLLAALI